MTLEPCPACDHPRCFGRCHDYLLARRNLRRFAKTVGAAKDGRVAVPVLFEWMGPIYWPLIDVAEILDEATVGVLFEKPDKVRYLKKCERVGAVVPDYFVEDEHE